MFGLPWHIILPTLLGSVLSGALCSVMGIFVVRMKLSSLGFAMSHAAFAGAALGWSFQRSTHCSWRSSSRLPSRRFSGR